MEAGGQVLLGRCRTNTSITGSVSYMVVIDSFHNEMLKMEMSCGI